MSAYAVDRVQQIQVNKRCGCVQTPQSEVGPGVPSVVVLSPDYDMTSSPSYRVLKTALSRPQSIQSQLLD
jgi:hypothetical protein